MPRETYPKQERRVFTSAFTVKVCEQLGIDPQQPGLTAESILQTLDARLQEQAYPTLPPAPPGKTYVAQADLDELYASIERGRQVEQQKADATIDREVQAALNAGRIPAFRAGDWRQLLRADLGAAETLQAQPNVVPLAEVGNSGGLDESSADHDMTDDTQLFARALNISAREAAEIIRYQDGTAPTSQEG